MSRGRIRRRRVRGSVTSVMALSFKLWEGCRFRKLWGGWGRQLAHACVTQQLVVLGDVLCELC